jgi:hypothetical protein
MNKNLFKESTETSVVYPAHISKVFQRYLIAFQQFISKLELKNLSPNEARNLYQELLPFKKFNFSATILANLETYLKRHQNFKRDCKNYRN